MQPEYINVQREIAEYLNSIPDNTGKCLVNANANFKTHEVVEILARQESRLAAEILKLRTEIAKLQLKKNLKQ